MSAKHRHYRRWKNPHYQKRLFLCPHCGTVVPAIKHKGRTKPGHLKNMYCYVCRMVTEHVQIE